MDNSFGPLPYNFEPASREGEQQPTNRGRHHGNRREIELWCQENYGEPGAAEHQHGHGERAHDPARVNRPMARSIVEYRDCIGGFKKVEDLALVNGIGATKLEIIKVEICVSSRTSSSQHSPSSLRRDPEHMSSCSGMNINTATPPQLMSIRGITEKIARNIVAYRTQHGPFKSIEDLVRVDHINCSLPDKIRFQVFVERSRTPSTNTNGGLTYTGRSHPSPTSFSLRSDDLDLPPGGPTQMVSLRPRVAPAPGPRDGRAAVPLATWDLQRCSSEKANNPGVKEVVCMTLLENEPPKTICLQPISSCRRKPRSVLAV
ncbi:unnamed protein product [Gadus morhua 'NCC']